MGHDIISSKWRYYQPLKESFVEGACQCLRTWNQLNTATRSLAIGVSSGRTNPASSLAFLAAKLPGIAVKNVKRLLFGLRCGLAFFQNQNTTGKPLAGNFLSNLRKTQHCSVIFPQPLFVLLLVHKLACSTQARFEVRISFVFHNRCTVPLPSHCV